MSGRVGDLSPKQAEALDEFRERIGDVHDKLPIQSDHYLLRWLRARNFSINKAEAMLRKHVEFRKHMKVDSILEDWMPPELEKPVEAITLIYDCEGLGMKHMYKPAVEAYGEILTMFEDNYPEGLKRVLVIKAPKIFPIAYNLIKHFLCEETRRKIIVVGSNWKDVLQKYVAPDQLPVAYGGLLVDPDGDPYCKSKIKYGGVVPKSYYIRESVKVQYDNFVTISRGSDLQLEYEILVRNCLLRWQFAGDGADIGFGIYMKTKAGVKQKVGDMQEVFPTTRYNAHLVPEDGSYTCEEPGIYVIRFDNTYSMLQSKKISFSVDVVLPETHTNSEGQA
ncbi:SEC14-like protein 2 isoform X2 [Pygocentrus nattereri]|uniref:SEC14-like protein 2 isoform X2 n=1 Tax=Pygocentrus nattereri TaxID=42514 RepID=UPI0008149B04|nr:SEC14-like protein 2 isoform X2 [Pygocentrus nattereri]